jgi:predicted RNA-binding Zn-ribbon protein involved in translation (DUF1610 family)
MICRILANAPESSATKFKPCDCGSERTRITYPEKRWKIECPECGKGFERGSFLAAANAWNAAQNL